MKEMHGLLFEDPNLLYAISTQLFLEDLLYTDKISSRWTVRRQEGFYSYSEIFRINFREGYLCDKLGKVYATTARTVSYSHLKQVLLSKDESLFR